MLQTRSSSPPTGSRAQPCPSSRSSCGRRAGRCSSRARCAELRYARPHYARGGFDYWQQLPDGRLVLGGRRDASLEEEWTAVEETTPAVQGPLEHLARELAGGAVEITHRWAGIWGTTPDLLPLAGRVPGRERTWVAAGYSGHGNVLGLVCGSLVADAVAGDEVPDLALFDPERLV